MDTMNIRDIWLVAIPEISLSLFFGLLLINRDIFSTKNRTLVGVIRFVASVIIVLVVNYYSRQMFQHIILISYCTVIAYATAFFIAFRQNVRQSILVGLLITYLIIGAEIITLPLMNTLMQRLEALSLFSIRFTLSIPSRIIDIIVILTTIIFKISVDTKLTNKKWASLEVKEKTATLMILTLFIAVIMMATNNIEIFAKLMENGIDTSFVIKNLQYEFYGIVLFMVISIILFYTIVKCYKYKEIALKTPEQILNDIGSISPTDKIHEYMCILDKYKGGKVE